MAAATDAEASPQERAEMLMEIAMGLQARPQSAQQLADAIGLYERALEVAPAEAALLQARIGARMGTALQALPDADAPGLERALQCFQAAIVTLQHLGPRRGGRGRAEPGLGAAVAQRHRAGPRHRRHRRLPARAAQDRKSVV